MTWNGHKGFSSKSRASGSRISVSLPAHMQRNRTVLPSSQKMWSYSSFGSGKPQKCTESDSITQIVTLGGQLERARRVSRVWQSRSSRREISDYIMSKNRSKKLNFVYFNLCYLNIDGRIWKPAIERDDCLLLSKSQNCVSRLHLRCYQKVDRLLNQQLFE